MNKSVEDESGGRRRGDARAREDLEIRRYLLGEGLSDEDRDDFEERLSQDGALFGRMRLMEEELIDDYVMENLTEGERRSFEKHFLSTPARLRSVKVALAFAALAAERAEEETPATAPARHGLLGKLRARLKLPEDFFVLVLTPELVRGAGGGVTGAQTPAGGLPLQINLLLEEDLYTSYSAEVRTARGGRVWAEENLPARETEAGPAVVLTLPQGLAGANTYTVTLSGASDDGAYEKVGIYIFGTK